MRIQPKALGEGSDRAPPRGAPADDPDEPPDPGARTAAKAAARAGLRLRHRGADHSLVAARAFEAGELMFEFLHLTWRPERDRLTVEHPGGGHFFDPLLARVAHSCDPNARVSAKLMALVARRRIQPGETITYDYGSTERALSVPFACRCGAASCRGWIAGPSPQPLLCKA